MSDPVLVRDACRYGQTDARLVPASVLLDVPSELPELASMIGVGVGQLEPMRGGAFQAELDVPPGFWRIWPHHAVALWIGRAPNASMPHVALPHRGNLDLLTTLLRLHRSGVWLQEARLVLTDGERTESSTLEAIIAALHSHADRVAGVAGFWGDTSGNVVEGEVFRSGEVRVGSPTAAIRWLETAYGLK